MKILNILKNWCKRHSIGMNSYPHQNLLEIRQKLWSSMDENQLLWLSCFRAKNNPTQTYLRGVYVRCTSMKTLNCCIISNEFLGCVSAAQPHKPIINSKRSYVHISVIENKVIIHWTTSSKGGRVKVSHRSGDWLPFLTGSCYGHKNSWLSINNPSRRWQGNPFTILTCFSEICPRPIENYYFLRSKIDFFFFNFFIPKSYNFISNLNDDFHEAFFEVYYIAVSQKLVIS